MPCNFNTCICSLLLWLKEKLQEIHFSLHARLFFTRLVWLNVQEALFHTRTAKVKTAISTLPEASHLFVEYLRNIWGEQRCSKDCTFGSVSRTWLLSESHCDIRGAWVHLPFSCSFYVLMYTKCFYLIYQVLHIRFYTDQLEFYVANTTTVHKVFFIISLIN